MTVAIRFYNGFLTLNEPISSILVAPALYMDGPSMSIYCPRVLPGNILKSMEWCYNHLLFLVIYIILLFSSFCAEDDYFGFTSVICSAWYGRWLYM